VGEGVFSLKIGRTEGNLKLSTTKLECTSTYPRLTNVKHYQYNKSISGQLIDISKPHSHHSASSQLGLGLPVSSWSEYGMSSGLMCVSASELGDNMFSMPPT